ncbi:hypothetical protein KC686_01445 [Candidatus Woesebacteria bacterium]|nr:hypothetical protein [Candidatus Woesebacteria bacterium]
MASGVVTVLTGDDRYKKAELSSGEKTYVFEVLVGLETDTHDMLGMITKIDDAAKVEQQQLEQIVLALSKKEQQAIHAFSAKRYEGESYFDVAKKGKKPPQTMQRTKILQWSFLSSKDKRVEELLQTSIEQIKRVDGNFRQKEVIQQWENIPLEIKNKYFTVLKCQVKTTKQFYVRALVRDIAAELQIPLTAYSITRIQNGPFRITDCVCVL